MVERREHDSQYIAFADYRCVADIAVSEEIWREAC
jgi:hypothetical protein